MTSKWTPAWISVLILMIIGTVSAIFLLRAVLLGDFGMDSHMLEQANEARAELSKAKTDAERCFPLAEIAKDDVDRGKVEEARKYAIELLAIAEKHKSKKPSDDDSEYGIAVHDGNMVLGRIALKEHKVEEAKQYLLKAGMTSGAPTLNSFGPNMKLAKELIEAGERDTVLEYFHECHRFWSYQDKTLKDWEETVKSGGTPNFGANLYY